LRPVQNLRSSGGTHGPPDITPREAALVAAAVGARRAGYHEPLPADVLERMHIAYLAERGGPVYARSELVSPGRWNLRSRCFYACRTLRVIRTWQQVIIAYRRAAEDGVPAADVALADMGAPIRSAPDFLADSGMVDEARRRLVTLQNTYSGFPQDHLVKFLLEAAAQNLSDPNSD
jgi:hypothetical protein